MGKTSILNVMMGIPFSEKVNNTIGVDFYRKLVKVDDNTFLRIQFWDTAGQEKYRSVAMLHLKGKNELKRRERSGDCSRRE